MRGRAGRDCGKGGDLGQSEIKNLHTPVAAEQDVGGLEVAVDDTGVVRGSDAVSDLGTDFQRAGDIGVAAYRLAIDELGYEIAFADIVHAYDVRMVQGSYGARLLLESLQPRPVLRDFLGQDLERDVALQPGVPRTVDLAHATGAKGSKYFVPVEARARRKSQDSASLSSVPRRHRRSKVSACAL